MPWGRIAAASTSAGSPRPPPAANEGAPGRRGAQLRRPRRQAGFTLQGRHRAARRRADRARRCGTRTRSWPVYSKFFDNLGPIPHHMHQSNEQAALVGQQGKPESYYFPPQLNATGNNFPYTFFGLEPGTTKDDIRRCLERWNEGDNGILDLSQGVSPQAGHRLAGPALRAARPRLAGDLRAAVGLRRLRHVPVDGRGPAPCPGSCWSRTSPRTSTTTSTTWSSSSTGRRTSNPSFKDHHYLEPIPVADVVRRGLRRQVDRLRQGRRQGAVQRQGADRRARRVGHDQGQRGLRPDRRPGTRHDRQARRRCPARSASAS